MNTKGLSRVRVATEAELEDEFRADYMRMMMHVSIASIEVDSFRENTLVKSQESLSKLGRFADELATTLKGVSRKLRWFIGIEKIILGERNQPLLDQELDPNGHKIANIAQLTDWVINAKRDVSNAVDVVTNNSRRRELFLKAWKEALEGTGQEWSPHHQIRFQSWYTTQFPPPPRP